MAWMRYNRMANNSRRPTRKHGRSSFLVVENVAFSSLDQIIEIGPLVRLIEQKLIIVRLIFRFAHACLARQSNAIYLYRYRYFIIFRPALP